MQGRTDRQVDFFDDIARLCDQRLPERSIYSFLRRERDHLFPDAAFADLFDKRGRYSVPPSIVAVVMVLQRLEGLSDREAVERYTFDTRWRYSCGLSGYGAQWPTFAHTVLVDMRERLRRSERPDRIFEVALGAAQEAGLLGQRRVVDSTPLYDAVTTMGTIILIRSAIRGLLRVAGPELEANLRSVLRSGDDYASSDNPQIDWEDREAREALIDSRAKDAQACLLLLDGLDLDPEVAEAVRLLAKATGQDLEEGEDGVLRIARKVAPDRIISTVDPDARHGHKSEARGFDGYKGHVAVDPDSEIITGATVTPGNAGDSSVAKDLIADLITERPEPLGREHAEVPAAEAGDSLPERVAPDAEAEAEKPTLYADTEYGSGEFQAFLESAGIESRCKTQRLSSVNGMYSKDQFTIDLEGHTVTCPNGVSVTIRPAVDGGGVASFGSHCRACPLVEHCTRSRSGRTVTVNIREDVLARARARQTDPAWVADYRATRPKIERKLAHLTRHKHGGRKARVRGLLRVGDDFRMRAAAMNLARLATIGVCWTSDGWRKGVGGNFCPAERCTGHRSRPHRDHSKRCPALRRVPTRRIGAIAWHGYLRRDAGTAPSGDGQPNFTPAT